MQIAVLDLHDFAESHDSEQRQILLAQLRDAIFNVGFLYIKNHGVSPAVIAALEDRLPQLFALLQAEKLALSKLNSPHFLGYSGFGEETTQGKQDLREQFDFATELTPTWQEVQKGGESVKDYNKPYWQLRGPNQWPNESILPGFRVALTEYHDALATLSCKFVHLVEEAIGVPIGTFDDFFTTSASSRHSSSSDLSSNGTNTDPTSYRPQHRIKLLKYHATGRDDEGQGVGAHKDSSGWLTFLYQVGNEPGLEVLDSSGNWVPATPISGTFVVNFGNAFEAATDGAVRATIHRVKAPKDRDRYSIPFFMGLPLDLTVSEIRARMPEDVRGYRTKEDGQAAVEAAISSFLDPRWDELGESQLRKWIRSHRDVGVKWYGEELVEYYTKDVK